MTLFYQLIALHRNIKKIAESFIFLRCCQDSEEIIQVCGSISTPVSSKWDFLASFNISFWKISFFTFLSNPSLNITWTRQYCHSLHCLWLTPVIEISNDVTLTDNAICDVVTGADDVEDTPEDLSWHLISKSQLQGLFFLWQCVY